MPVLWNHIAAPFIIRPGTDHQGQLILRVSSQKPDLFSLFISMSKKPLWKTSLYYIRGWIVNFSSLFQKKADFLLNREFHSRSDTAEIGQTGGKFHRRFYHNLLNVFLRPFKKNDRRLRYARGQTTLINATSTWQHKFIWNFLFICNKNKHRPSRAKRPHQPFSGGLGKCQIPEKDPAVKSLSYSWIIMLNRKNGTTELLDSS